MFITLSVTGSYVRIIINILVVITAAADKAISNEVSVLRALHFVFGAEHFLKFK